MFSNHRKLLDQALKAYGGREIYKPEIARATYKRSKVLHLLGRSDQAREDLMSSRELLRMITRAPVNAEEDLQDSDFDEQISFWSR